MLPQELAAQLLEAEMAGALEIENERFLLGEHLPLRQPVRTAASLPQSSDAIHLRPTPPRS